MSLTVNRNSYLQCVNTAFLQGPSNPVKEKVSRWVQESYHPDSLEACDKEASDLLPRFTEKTNRKRYTYDVTPTEQLLKDVFDISFQRDPGLFMRTAQQLNPSAKFSSKGVKVHVLDAAYSFFSSDFVRLCLCVITGIYTIWQGRRIYRATHWFFTARVLPFVINHTPILAVRVLNRGLGLRDAALLSYAWVKARLFTFLFRVFIARSIVVYLLPEIPVVTPLMRMVGIWNLYNFFTIRPVTLSTVLSDFAWSIGTSVWNTSDFMSQLLEPQVLQAKADLTAANKEVAYRIWRHALAQQAREVHIQRVSK